ncbi:hypothetical protein INR49_018952 [Caranx melampygus]|nr:hypothetical protein INR49_018952 [Caranx melampygus]
MAEDVTVSEERLSAAVGLLVNLGKTLLLTAKQDAAASLENFVPYKITTLFGLITAGTDLYKSIGVKKKSEAEALWQKFYHHEAVREKVEELLELESEWDSFMERVDKDLQATDRQLSGQKLADSLSPDMSFTDARSGKSVTLGDYLGRGQKTVPEARSLRVLVVSFGGLEGAQLWLQQTGCTFDMLLDPQRKVYRSFGLGSSYAKVMKFSCLLQYSEYGVAKRDAPDIPPRLLEDIYQLGGDFVLDEAGKVIFSHPSKNPLDRPTVTNVLQVAAHSE